MKGHVTRRSGGPGTAQATRAPKWTRHNAPMTSRKEHLDGLAIGTLLACCMFWGLQQVLVKSIMSEVAPLFQASLRCMGACVLLWGLVLALVAANVVAALRDLAAK